MPVQARKRRHTTTHTEQHSTPRTHDTHSHLRNFDFGSAGWASSASRDLRAACLAGCLADTRGGLGSFAGRAAVLADTQPPVSLLNVIA